MWGGLTTKEKRVVSLIADQEAPLYGVEAGQKYGLSRGGATGTLLRKLIDAGDVVRNADSVSRHRLVDPLLARWVRSNI